MTHKCANAVNGCLDDNNHCKKGYMDTVIQPRTTFDVKGYPIYKRLQAADLRVVPHNKDILMDWQGHAYVDWCASTYTVLYLYQVGYAHIFNLVYYYFTTYIFYSTYSKELKRSNLDSRTQRISQIMTRFHYISGEDIFVVWMQCGEHSDIM
jgi:hypothetical protein